MQGSFLKNVISYRRNSLTDINGKLKVYPDVPRPSHFFYMNLITFKMYNHSRNLKLVHIIDHEIYTYIFQISENTAKCTFIIKNQKIQFSF